MLVVSIKLQFDNDGHLYSILLSLSPKNNDNLLEADTLAIFLLQIVLIFAVVNHFLLKVSSCRRNQGRGVAGEEAGGCAEPTRPKQDRLSQRYVGISVALWDTREHDILSEKWILS